MKNIDWASVSLHVYSQVLDEVGHVRTDHSVLGRTGCPAESLSSHFQAFGWEIP